MGTLVLLRHGQSQWNLENRFTGWTDVPLTEVGQEEAHRAAKALAEHGLEFQWAFTSLLSRAQETLSIVLADLGQDPPVERDSALNERHYGELQGLNKAETAEKYGADQVHQWRRSYDIPPPGGECLADTARRTLPYFREYVLPRVAEGGNVIVAAHGNSLRSIAMYLEGMNREEILAFEMGTGIPFLYQVGPDGAVSGNSVLL